MAPKIQLVSVVRHNFPIVARTVVALPVVVELLALVLVLSLAAVGTSLFWLPEPVMFWKLAAVAAVAGSRMIVVVAVGLSWMLHCVVVVI